jgi:hypothetical protein
MDVESRCVYCSENALVQKLSINATLSLPSFVLSPSTSYHEISVLAPVSNARLSLGCPRWLRMNQAIWSRDIHLLRVWYNVPDKPSSSAADVDLGRCSA